MVAAADYSERDLQRAVARLLDVTGLPWFHPANERKCSPRQGAALKALGVKAGVPDILVLRPFDLGDCRFSGLAIELKARRGSLTEAQREWSVTLTRCGWLWEVHRDIEGVMATLRRCYPGRLG